MSSTDSTSAILSSPWYLAKPNGSIYNELTCLEYPNPEQVHGWVVNKMGAELRANQYKFPTQLAMMEKYEKLFNPHMGAFSTSHALPGHGWGRLEPNKHLSLSVMTRPARHGLATGKYNDLDIENAQPAILCNLMQKAGAKCTTLADYVANRNTHLEQLQTYYGCTKNEAKDLIIRLMNGGSYRRWAEDVKTDKVCLPFVRDIMAELKPAIKTIYEANRHIESDVLELNPSKWDERQEAERGVFALYMQTHERVLQEMAIQHLVDTYTTPLNSIIPCQDGFMILNEHYRNGMEASINDHILTQCQVPLSFVCKPFDEAVTIPAVKGTPTVSVTIEELNRGERYIADKIAPLLRGKIMYDNSLKTWYYTSDTGLWVKSSKANEHMICLTIQDLIEAEKERVWALFKAESDDEKKKKLQKQESELTKMYTSVGRRGYISQVAIYLQQILSCPGFENKLDCTRGKLVFANGIYDIRSETFKLGITPDDMVSFTLSVNYKYRQHDSKKMKFVRDRFREIMNNNEEHLEYFLAIIGYAMTGDASLEKALYFFRDGTDACDGDNGKTFIFNILKKIFDEIIHMSDPKMIEDGYAKSHKHLCQTKNQRIVYADEGKQKKLNASLIKTIADGLFIESEVMFGTTEKIPVYYKYFMCSNHEFVVDEGENAVYNRFRPIVCASHFDRHGKRTEANPAKLEFIADPTLADRIATEYIDEVIELVLFYAHRYYTEGIPKPPQMFVESANKTKLANNEFATALYDCYVADPEGKVAEADILQKCQLPYKCTQPRALREHMKRLGLKYNKDLSGLGSNRKGGYVGLSLKPAEASADASTASAETSTDKPNNAVSDDEFDFEKDGQKHMIC